MQAAARRTAGISKPRRPDRLNATPHLAAVDDIGLLEALPLGAAIFTTNDRKLWLEAGNKRFFELAGCDQAPNKFAETFKRYAEGTGGQFIQASSRIPPSHPTRSRLSRAKASRGGS